MTTIRRILGIVGISVTLAASAFAVGNSTKPAAAAAPNGCYAAQEASGGLYFVYPPGTLRLFAQGTASVSCSYSSGGGKVAWQCELDAGFCTIARNGTTVGSCSGALASCPAFPPGTFLANPGDVITVTVVGGWAAAFDQAIPSCVPQCQATEVITS